MTHTHLSPSMRVVLLSHSDIMGGASVVTFRLMQALRQQGIDARMIVMSKQSDSPWVSTIGSFVARGYTFMRERLGIALANGMSREDMFKVSTASTGMSLHRHPWLRKADVVVIGWINQGLMSLKMLQTLHRMHKPIVWTMHDMWCCTGICHHAHSCQHYRQECGQCPYLHSQSSNDLSHRIWKRKKSIYSSVPIHFVAVSHWLEEVCRKSSLMADANISVIPNAFPIESFHTSARVQLPHLKKDTRIILMGAARLDDPIKGLPHAIEALNMLFDTDPDITRNTIFVLFGSLRNPAALDTLRFPHHHLGMVNDWRLLRRLYASSHVVLSSSLWETLPGTLIEGQASGCLPVTFGKGGQTDIVTHLKDGYIARYLEASDLAAGIKWALSQHVDREAMHQSVADRFAASSVAKKYISLFNELLHEH